MPAVTSVEVRVVAAADEAELQRRQQARLLRLQRRQQDYWRVRMVPESGAQPHRGLFLYNGHDLRRLPLAAQAFWMLGTEFARLLGFPPALTDGSPAASAATAVTACPPTRINAHGQPLFRWRRNSYFDYTDDLLLFCLLYYKAKDRRARWVRPRGKKGPRLPRRRQTPLVLTPKQVAALEKSTQVELADDLNERRRKSSSPVSAQTSNRQQSTVSRWLVRSSERVAEALRNYSLGTPAQQAIATKVLNLSATLTGKTQALTRPQAS